MSERTSDVLDFASELEEADRVKAAAFRKPSPALKGVCLVCAAEVPSFAQFCGVPCRDDYERQEKRQRRG
jgi:hypothetical protein